MDAISYSTARANLAKFARAVEYEIASMVGLLIVRKIVLDRRDIVQPSHTLTTPSLTAPSHPICLKIGFVL